MKKICVLLVLLCAPVSFAELKLIPTPQKIEMKQGKFALSSDPERAVHIEKTTEPVNKAGAEESYQLIVAPDAITIRSSGDAGIFYAKQTLKQLVRANVN